MKDLSARKGPDAGTLLMAIAMTALVMGKAHGADLKPASMVSADVITVGDVFDGSGEFSSRYLAPAPAPGHALTLKAADLGRISRAFGLGWTAKGGETLTIRRQSPGIDRYAIEAALQERLAAELPGQRLEIELSEANPFIPLPGGGTSEVAVDKLRLDLQKGAFTATMKAGAAEKDVSGRLLSFIEVPVLRNPLRKGDVIGSDDIEYVEISTRDVSSTTIVDSAKLVGQTPRRGISAMKPVAAADIETPPMVKKGDIVTALLQNGMLGLSMQARALETGAEGDVIRIVNTASNRTLEGVVTGHGSVTIRLPSLDRLGAL